MMTTSLELSKKLAEAGLRIETEKWYCDVADHRFGRDTDRDFRLYDIDTAKARKCNTKGEDIQYPAYQTDELLAVMPDSISNMDIPGIDMLEISKLEDLYVVRYGIAKIYSDKSLPEALGKMILWLLDNGYVFRDNKLVKGKNEKNFK